MDAWRIVQCQPSRKSVRCALRDWPWDEVPCAEYPVKPDLEKLP